MCVAGAAVCVEWGEGKKVCGILRKVDLRKDSTLWAREAVALRPLVLHPGHTTFLPVVRLSHVVCSITSCREEPRNDNGGRRLRQQGASPSCEDEGTAPQSLE